ncbi:carboxymethylenebutenolidase [Coleophoma crateriformis]|uniref:Carboxymethylenebutenolidase n=1 Tax=Coleophoma crateriformis TaxID=565419 RepID=A0A3D8SZS3_9HELO|nr:carboxymethylenebutenolidase [Coleophoma crateriformis]
MGSIAEIEAQVVLPKATLVDLLDAVSLLPPLSRRGHGPGLIVLLPKDTPTYLEGGVVCENGLPPPLLKWAEEGFAVVQVLETALGDLTKVNEVFTVAINALRECSECHIEDGVGLVVYDAQVWERISNRLILPSEISAALFYSHIQNPITTLPPLPTLQHLAGSAEMKSTRLENSTIYKYPSLQSARFAIPGLAEFSYASEAVSHTRNLSFLKKYIRGADFDLEAIWEEHTYFEFEDRSVPKTMSTMVQEPYVNHIPTITGGIGRSRLTNFYTNHFIYSNPKDTETELVSRTIGIDRVCDEFIFRCTHDSTIDWLIPGIPPTGKKLRVPCTSVVNIRGDRLYHEHISWDQGTVLCQLGLMPEYLPYPYPLSNETGVVAGKLEFKVPATGIETVEKMMDKNSVPSNAMLEYKVRQVAE